MKYKVGDRVKIKSLDWYNKNKNKRGDISFPYEAEVVFASEMSSFCGQIVTISQKSYTQDIGFYRIREDDNIYMWTDEMIECKVEDETKPKFKVGDRVKWFNYTCSITSIDANENTYTYLIKHNDYREDETFAKWVPESELTFEDEETSIKLTGKAIKNNEMVLSIDEYILPEGYIFKDENGNEINATKIVLEKKKKEYPKTYEECYQVTGLSKTSDIYGYKNGLLFEFQKLLIARDAYWKIAGVEMGLGKSWEPPYGCEPIDTFCLQVYHNRIIKVADNSSYNCILTFPTEEMRDAFKENFDPDIEICKEFL